MKSYMLKLNGILLLSALFLISFVTSCSDDDDKRAFEKARIVGVRIDNELFTPIKFTELETVVEVPAGKNLSNSKLHILVANGILDKFVNGVEYDCRKPLSVSINGYDGTLTKTNLRIKSAPKLLSFVIKGMTIAQENIHESESRIIVQVPKNTDLTALEVTMEFANGSLRNFENGVSKDYSTPCNFSLLGVDDETVYPYELIITTESVGPASVNAIVVNGIESDSIVTSGNTLIPFVPSLMDFSSVNVELKVGFGNTIEEGFTGQGLNLLSGNNKVKVTGTNGIVTEFVIAVPQLSFDPLFTKAYSEMGFAANDLCAVGFSNRYLLAGNYTSTAKTPVYYSFTGEKAGQLSAEGVNPTGYGFRKFATDDSGNILALSLGMSAGEQWIYKWDNVGGKGSEYLSFSKSSLGVDYNPRAAGINILGSLDGNAKIMLTIAQKTDIFVWTVNNGILDAKPKKYSFPLSGTGYYWSICAMPSGKNGYLGFAAMSTMDNSGVICLNDMMGETQRSAGMSTTDGATITYNNRDYLAFVSHNNSKATMWLCDITDGQLESYKNPIFKRDMKITGANANATMDADLVEIDGKLYVAFACTNLGLYLYEFK